VVPGGGREWEGRKGEALEKKDRIRRDVGLWPGVRTPYCLAEDVCYETVQVTNRCTLRPRDDLLLAVGKKGGDKRFLAAKLCRDSASRRCDFIVSSQQ